MFVDPPWVSTSASGRKFIVRRVWAPHTLHRRLSREHHVRERSLPGDFDPVVESGECAMDPARATVARHVLIDVRCDERARDVRRRAPVKGGGKRSL
eukprot:scaffold180581_cov25-Tisochrysis_lutea.AAC.3